MSYDTDRICCSTIEEFLNTHEAKLKDGWERLSGSAMKTPYGSLVCGYKKLLVKAEPQADEKSKAKKQTKKSKKDSK